MKVVHDWLKEYTGPSLPSPRELEELLMFHVFEVEGVEEVEGHTVLDLKVLPDRASFCLSHRGIAREIASITRTSLVHDPLLSQERLPIMESGITVHIEDTHACTRFSTALVTGITVGESPVWLQSRLRALGQRPINNVVDATNYVMYALGQPLHAYDAQKFPKHDGAWQFDVRFAREGETINLIAEGGKQEDRIVTLTGSELLIVDGSSDTPVGLAGIKGGAYAGVDSTTTDILIEAAHFDPLITRKTARRLGIVIDGSKRFENDPSPELVPHALREVVALITQIAGGTCEGAIDIDHSVSRVRETVVSPKRVNALLGLSLSVDAMRTILHAIGATVTERGDDLLVTNPFERNDLIIEEDYIEEIGRLHGYAHVVSVVPAPVALAEINVRHYYSERVRTFLIAQGFSEVITSSFVKKDEIQLKNALASDKSYLRSTLRKNLMEVLDKNMYLVDLLGGVDTRVFEIGTVFDRKEGGGVHEHVSLAVGVRSKQQGYVPKDDVLLREICDALDLHLGGKAQWKIEKGIAECDLTALLKDLAVPTMYEHSATPAEITYQPFSLYPAISRDIALWVSEGTLPEEVSSVLDEHAGGLRIRTTLFDTFTKEGKTSYAFRLVFQAPDRTLTDGEVQEVMDAVYTAVQERQWQVR